MIEGVRIRAAPALNALQIGILPRGGTISYVEEFENDDGVWLKLTDEATAMHCDPKYSSQVRKKFYFWQAKILLWID